MGCSCSFRIETTANESSKTKEITSSVPEDKQRLPLRLQKNARANKNDITFHSIVRPEVEVEIDDDSMREEFTSERSATLMLPTQETATMANGDRLSDKAAAEMVLQTIRKLIDHHEQDQCHILKQLTGMLNIHDIVPDTAHQPTAKNNREKAYEAGDGESMVSIRAYESSLEAGDGVSIGSKGAYEPSLEDAMSVTDVVSGEKAKIYGDAPPPPDHLGYW